MQVTATANFSQLKTQINELKAQMAEIQKMSLSGGGLNSNLLAKGTKDAMANFERMVLASKAFNIETVKMSHAVDNFGSQLAKGQVGMQKAWSTWRAEAKGGAKMLDDLAARQTRLLRSTFIPDPNMQGYAKAITSVNGSMKELGAQAEYAKIRASALNSVMREVGTGMVNFGKNTQWAGRQLTVGLTMPLAMFGAAASKAYLDFDKQMTSMLKVYGAHAVVQTQQTLDVIEKQVTNLADKTARTLGVAMSDTVEIAKSFSSIGLESQNLIDATEATTRLMKLGDLQASQAAGSMVALQNVFKLQANEVGDAVNFLNAAKHSTSTTMQDIIDAIPRVGPIIQQMGGTYKDFTAMLVAMKESGVPAAQGANAIKSMLASIIRPTTQAKADLKALNIDLGQIAAKNSGNVLGMVMDLQKSLNALPKAERLKVIEEVFGKFQFARVTALLNNLGAAGSQSAKVLELYGQSNDQLAAVAKQELNVASDKTPAAQFQKMKATLQADLIPLGRQFLTAFTQIGNFLDKFVSFAKSISKALGPIAGVLGSLTTKGLGAIMIIGPITMLVGLFVNLAGQIFKMAHFSKMFRDGFRGINVEATGIKGALQGISLYFEEIDLAEKAANASADTFNSTIMSTAESFKFLNAQVSQLKTEMGYLAGTTSRTIAPILNPSAWNLTPSMPPGANGKMGGYVRPHMYAGSALRSDWQGMSQAQRMQYPSLFAMQQMKGPQWLSGESGYLERGLTAQYTAAPKGIPSLLNTTYGSKPAIYGGSTGIAKEQMMVAGTEKLIATHNEVIAGITKVDQVTAAQLQSIFGTERVTSERAEQLLGKKAIQAGDQAAEQLVKIEQALDSVIFEEGVFKENMIKTLLQEEAIISQVETTGSRISVDVLKGKLEAALRMSENERLPAIQAAWQDFNNTLTVDAVAAVERMKLMLTTQMAGMPVGGAAMLGAETQAGLAIRASQVGVSELEASVSQSAGMLKSTIPMLADGGKVVGPGGPREDKVPAMLSGGEYVIKASSVNKYGTGLLDAVNNGYATGGPVQYFNDGTNNPVREKEWNPAELQGQSRGENYFIRRMSQNSRLRNAVYEPLMQSLKEMGTSDYMMGTINNAFNADRNLVTQAQRRTLAQGLKRAIARGRIDINALSQSERAYVASTIHNELFRSENVKRFSQLDPELQTLYTEGRGVPYAMKGARRESFQRAYGDQGLSRMSKAIPGIAEKFGIDEAFLRNHMFEMNAAHVLPLMVADGGHIPAMLSNGEYVMSPGATAAHGKDFMASINNGTAKFANGGGVPRFSGGGPFSSLRNAQAITGISPSPQQRGGSFASRGVLVNAEQSLSTQYLAGGKLLLEPIKQLAINVENSAIDAKVTLKHWNAELKTDFQQGVAKTKEAYNWFTAKWQEIGQQYITGIRAANGEVITTTRIQAKLGQKVVTETAIIAETGVAKLGYAIQKGANFTETVFKTIAEKTTQAGNYVVEALQQAAGKIKGVMLKGSEAGAGVGKGRWWKAAPKEGGGMGMGGMGLMMGGMMLEQAASGMKEGQAKNAVSGLGTGANMGGMAMMMGASGPAAAAIMASVVAFKLIKGAIDEYKQKLKEQAAALKEAYTVGDTAAHNLGITLHKFGETTDITSTKLAKAASAMSKAAEAYKASEDETTKDSLAKVKSLVDEGDQQKELIRIAKEKYNTDLASGASVEKARADALGFMQAGGAGKFDITAIGKSLAATTGVQGFKQNVAGLTSLYNKPTSFGQAMFGQTNEQLASETAGSSMMSLMQTTNDKNFMNVLNGLDKSGQKTMFSVQAFRAMNAEIKKTDPTLAALNEKLLQNGTNVKNIDVANKLFNDGLITTDAQFKAVANSAGLAAQMMSQYASKEAIANSKSTTGLMGLAAIATAPRDTSAGTGGGSGSGGGATKDTPEIAALKKAIKLRQDQMDAINKEIQARQKLFDTQQKTIDQQKTLADLQGKITSAGASGDLIAMAQAQSDYNVELAKQQNINDKDKADSKDNAKIANLQEQIDRLTTRLNNAQQRQGGGSGGSGGVTGAAGGTGKANPNIVSDLKVWASLVQKIANKTPGTEKTGFAAFEKAAFANKQVAATLHLLGSKSKQDAYLKEIWKKDSTQGGIATARKGYMHLANEFAHTFQYKAYKIHPASAQQLATTYAKYLQKGYTAAEIKKKMHKDVQEALIAGGKDGSDKSVSHLQDILAKKHLSLNYDAKAIANKFVQDHAQATTDIAKQYHDKLNDPAAMKQMGADLKAALKKGGTDASQDTVDALQAKLTGKKFQAKFEIDLTGVKVLAGEGNQGWFQYYPAGNYPAGTKKANGGIIHASNGIGPVVGPGGPKADLVPAMLSNGEYVIQASSVGKYGVKMMDSINKGTYTPHYATGGIIKKYDVGNVGGSKSDHALPAPQYNVNIVVNGANGDPSQIADMVATRFRREAEVMSSGRTVSV